MTVDPRGPVLISYRQSDGRDPAVALAWALRAAGVPVWHDQTDLPPGDTRRRLDEALDSGLSGAVLLVTPEIEHSSVVREQELPRLLSLAADPSFTLSVASTIERENGGLDYDVPDRLLHQPAGTIEGLLQQPVSTPAQRAVIAHQLCRRRMEQLRPEVVDTGQLLFDVQTRVPPVASRFDADLMLRLRPPPAGQRRPSAAGLRDLQHFLVHLPELVVLAQAESISVRGGAHLSVACALGAALPTTLIGRVEVVATDGAVWTSSGFVGEGSGRIIGPCEPAVHEKDTGPVLLYVDLISPRSDAAFEEFVRVEAERFAGRVHLRPLTEAPLDSVDAMELTGELNHAIRALANQYRTTEVHLLLRCPYPIALLLGRSLNTLTAHLYEWDDRANPGTQLASYVPSLVLRSGSGGSSIDAVTAPRDLSPRATT